MLNGRVGQVVGPFDTTDLLSEFGAISQLTPETTLPVLEKLGIQAAVGTRVKINGALIKIGKTGIYELDQVTKIKHIVFVDGADENTIVDFIY